MSKEKYTMILASPNLKKYLEIANISHVDFAERIGFDAPTVSQVLNRKEEPSKKFIEQVLLKTDMRFDSAFEVKE
jgi:transcriptional regulator with XRE-family HTH domain